ncbi:MAG: hypothetical protein ACJ71Q_19830 [Terriglobales bacterium]
MPHRVENLKVGQPAQSNLIVNRDGTPSFLLKQSVEVVAAPTPDKQSSGIDPGDFDISAVVQSVENRVTARMKAKPKLNCSLCSIRSGSEVVLTYVSNHAVIGTRKMLLHSAGKHPPYQDNDSEGNESKKYSDAPLQFGRFG